MFFEDLPQIVALCERGRVRASRVCPAIGGVHLVLRRLFDPQFGPFLMVLPSPPHEVLRFRRHDFAAFIVGVVGRSGFSGNVFGQSAAVASGPSTKCRCVGSVNFLPGRPGLVDPSYVAKLGRAAHMHASLSRLFEAHEPAGVDDRERTDQRGFTGKQSKSRKARVEKMLTRDSGHPTGGTGGSVSLSYVIS
jgi:hypothetical protein